MKRRLSATGVVLGLVTFAAVACSDHTSLEDGNSPAGDYTYCGALTAKCNALYSASPTECSQAARDQCSVFQPAFSEALQSAVVSCAKDFSPCIGAFFDCIRSRTASTAPTAIQAKVKADFCAVCSDAENGGACSRFFVDGDYAERAWGMTGVGLRLLDVSDTIVAEIGTKCVGAAVASDGGLVLSDPGTDGGMAVCNPLAFRACADGIVQASATPGVCQK